MDNEGRVIALPVIIDYLGHSGFLVETDSALLLFDYYKGDISPLKQKTAGKPLFIFASHAHSDHFNPDIFSFTEFNSRVSYILSSDIKKKAGKTGDKDILFADAGKTYEAEGLGTIRTLLSTDEGVAFLVNTGGISIFHSGDLHFWDWPGEDPEWLAWQEETFCREIKRIAGTPVDIAFTVLDDRLLENFDRGMDLFLNLVRPRYALPMHFWHDRGVVNRFMELHQYPGTVIEDTAAENHWEIM